MQEIKSATKSLGGARSKQDILAERENDCSEELQTRLEAVMRRNAMSPNEGEVPYDFNLRMMGTRERVELSSFKRKKPVALVFGSYT